MSAWISAVVMVPALILVLAAWCPTTTTGPDRPRCCPCDTTSTATIEPSTTTSTAPALIIEPPHLVPSTPPTAPTTTTTAAPTINDAARLTHRNLPPRDLPKTGPDGDTIVAAGLLVILGGLFLAARPRTPPP